MSYLSYKTLSQKILELSIQHNQVENLVKNTCKNEPDYQIRFSYYQETLSKLQQAKKMQAEMLSEQIKREVTFQHLYNTQILVHNLGISTKHGLNSIVPIETMYCLCSLLSVLKIDLP